MKARKKTVRKGNFLKRVQNSARVKRVKAKIKKLEIARKKLSREYKTAIKSVSKQLAK